MTTTTTKLWIVNHQTLMAAEVPILRSLGWEVFVPKLTPHDRPARCDDRRRGAPGCAARVRA